MQDLSGLIQKVKPEENSIRMNSTVYGHGLNDCCNHRSFYARISFTISTIVAFQYGLFIAICRVHQPNSRTIYTARCKQYVCIFWHWSHLKPVCLGKSRTGVCLVFWTFHVKLLFWPVWSLEYHSNRAWRGWVSDSNHWCKRNRIWKRKRKGYGRERHTLAPRHRRNGCLVTLGSSIPRRLHTESTGTIEVYLQPHHPWPRQSNLCIGTDRSHDWAHRRINGTRPSMSNCLFELLMVPFGCSPCVVEPLDCFHQQIRCQHFLYDDAQQTLQQNNCSPHHIHCP